MLRAHIQKMPSIMIITLTLSSIFSTIVVHAITPLCEPSPDKDLCSKITKDALTWPEAMTNAIKFQLAVVEAGKSVAFGVGSELLNNLDPMTKQTISDVCEKNYNINVDNLNDSLGYVTSDPSKSLRVTVEFTDFSFCSDAFDDNNIPVPVDVSNYGKDIVKNIDVLSDLASRRPKA